MNRGRAIEVIQQQLGFQTIHATQIGQYIDDAQEDLETCFPHEELPWFMLTERNATSTKADEERVEVPDDFVQEYEEDGIWLQTAEGGERPIPKIDSDDGRLSVQTRYNYGELDQQTQEWPLCYALTGGYFRFFPKPLEVIEIKMIYYGRQALSVDNTDTSVWLKNAPKLITGWAGERIAGAKRDKEAFAIFQQWKQAGLANLVTRISERKLANRRSAMGETN